MLEENMSKKEVVSIRMTTEQRDYLRELADKQDMSLSKYIYRILFPKDEE